MARGWLDVQCHSPFLDRKLFFGQKTTIQGGPFFEIKFSAHPTSHVALNFQRVPGHDGLT